jgi:hypothetical protein
MPPFSFFSPQSKKPVTKDSPIWLQPIPLRLDAMLKADHASVSHADYFQAAQSFLEARSYDVVTRAVSQRLNQKVNPQDISQIHIRLVKHGAYYHPARVEIVVDSKQWPFVLNVALSGPGQGFVERDYQHLKKLNTETSFHYLPQVYGFDRITTPAGSKFGMFLGEWFDDYHEFHLAPDPADGKLKMVVWDEARGRYFLTDDQTKALYARAAKILTCYYNPASTEQILAWHHAAGDFVVKLAEDRLKLKLVTVRRYASAFESKQQAVSAADDPTWILQALLVFFLNLSIQMRLDRIEGVGDMVWSGKATIEATFTGFLDALSVKPDMDVLPDSVLACFVAYFSGCQASDLLDLSEAIVDRFNPRMPGLSVIKKNLNEHAETLHGTFQQFLSMS